VKDRYLRSYDYQSQRDNPLISIRRAGSAASAAGGAVAVTCLPTVYCYIPLTSLYTYTVPVCQCTSVSYTLAASTSVSRPLVPFSAWLFPKPPNVAYTYTSKKVPGTEFKTPRDCEFDSKFRPALAVVQPGRERRAGQPGCGGRVLRAACAAEGRGGAARRGGGVTCRDSTSVENMHSTEVENLHLRSTNV